MITLNQFLKKAKRNSKNKPVRTLVLFPLILLGLILTVSVALQPQRFLQFASDAPAPPFFGCIHLGVSDTTNCGTKMGSAGEVSLSLYGRPYDATKQQAYYGDRITGNLKYTNVGDIVLKFRSLGLVGKSKNNGSEFEMSPYKSNLTIQPQAVVTATNQSHLFTSTDSNGVYTMGTRAVDSSGTTLPSDEGTMKVNVNATCTALRVKELTSTDKNNLKSFCSSNPSSSLCSSKEYCQIFKGGSCPQSDATPETPNVQCDENVYMPQPEQDMLEQFCKVYPDSDACENFCGRTVGTSICPQKYLFIDTRTGKPIEGNSPRALYVRDPNNFKFDYASDYPVGAKRLDVPTHQTAQVYGPKAVAGAEIAVSAADLGGGASGSSAPPPPTTTAAQVGSGACEASNPNAAATCPPKPALPTATAAQVGSGAGKAATAPAVGNAAPGGPAAKPGSPALGLAVDKTTPPPPVVNPSNGGTIIPNGFRPCDDTNPADGAQWSGCSNPAAKITDKINTCANPNDVNATGCLFKCPPGNNVKDAAGNPVTWCSNSVKAVMGQQGYNSSCKSGLKDSNPTDDALTADAANQLACCAKGNIPEKNGCCGGTCGVWKQAVVGGKTVLTGAPGTNTVCANPSGDKLASLKSDDIATIKLKNDCKLVDATTGNDAALPGGVAANGHSKCDATYNPETAKDPICDGMRNSPGGADTSGVNSNIDPSKIDNNQPACGKVTGGFINPSQQTCCENTCGSKACHWADTIAAPIYCGASNNKLIEHQYGTAVPYSKDGSLPLCSQGTEYTDSLPNGSDIKCKVEDYGHVACNKDDINCCKAKCASGMGCYSGSGLASGAVYCQNKNGANNDNSTDTPVVNPNAQAVPAAGTILNGATCSKDGPDSTCKSNYCDGGTCSVPPNSCIGAGVTSDIASNCCSGKRENGKCVGANLNATDVPLGEDGYPVSN